MSEEIKEGAHSSLGASSAYRWFPCPGSIREINALPAALRDRPSYYAVEGSVCHDLAARRLLVQLTDAQLNELRGTRIAHPELPDEPVLVDDEMVDHIFGYCRLVWDLVAAHPGATLHVETRVRPVPDRPVMFGTADVIIVQPFGVLIVLDLKYGSGYVVEVEGNSQLMYYGLGSMREQIEPLDFERVQLMIYQPRAWHEDGPLRRWDISAQELLEWSDVLRAAGDRTRDPNAPLLPGDHCRWCPARARCPALQGVMEAEVGAVFDASPLDAAPIARTPAPDDLGAIARALMLVPVFEAWSKAVVGMAHAAAFSGYRIPNHKLVRGREGNREWVDEKTAAAALREIGLESGDIFTTPKLKSPAQIEKLAPGKNEKERKAWVGAYVTRSEGRLTLVPEDDSRPAVEQPLIEFPDDLPALAAGEEETDEWI